MDEDFKKWATIHGRMGFIFTVEDIAHSIGRPVHQSWFSWLMQFEKTGMIVRVGKTPAKDPKKKGRKIVAWQSARDAAELAELDRAA